MIVEFCMSPPREFWTDKLLKLKYPHATPSSFQIISSSGFPPLRRNIAVNLNQIKHQTHYNDSAI